VNSLDELREAAKYWKKRSEKAEKQLDDLRSLCVYGLWTKNGHLFYAGQTTDFLRRLQQHMSEMTSSGPVCVFIYFIRLRLFLALSILHQTERRVEGRNLRGCNFRQDDSTGS
jgi:hypothetical protein